MFNYVPPTDPTIIKNDLLFLNAIKKKKFDIAATLFEQKINIR